MSASLRSPRLFCTLGLLVLTAALALPVLGQERSYRGREGNVLDYSDTEIILTTIKSICSTRE